MVAALLVLPDGTLACGVTAARLWRCDDLVPAGGNGELEFLVAGRAGSVRLAGCRLRFTPVTGSGLPMGIPATSLARTVVDVAADLDFADAVALVEGVLRSEPERGVDLVTEQRRRLPRRGRDHLRAVLNFAGTLSESVLESHARGLFTRAGLPAPIQQATIRIDRTFIGRVDFLWPAERVIVEVDGLSKYHEPGELQREKSRQNGLIGAGYVVLRFTWHDIHHRAADVARQVAAALGASR